MSSNLPAARTAVTGKPTARTVATTLARAEERFLAPWDLYTTLRRDFPRFYQGYYTLAGGRADLSDPEYRRGLIDHLARRLVTDRRSVDEELFTLVPPLDRLEEVEAVLAPLVEATPAPDQNRVLIGLMVDGFPNGHPHSPEVYTETLIQQAKGYRPTTVASACRAITEGSKFLPSAAELREKLEEHSKPEESLRVVRQAMVVRRILDEALAAPPPAPPEPRPLAPPAQEWREGEEIPF